MIHFTKMQGLGNDYIYVNCFQETVENPEAFSPAISFIRGVPSSAFMTRLAKMAA